MKKDLKELKALFPGKHIALEKCYTVYPESNTTKIQYGIYVEGVCCRQLLAPEEYNFVVAKIIKEAQK